MERPSATPVFARCQPFFGEPFFGALACPAIADNLDNLSLSPSDETPMRTDRNLPNEPDTASRHEP
jgi:hypothetical protein